MSDTDVLIVGAGGAGTAAARELRRLHYPGHVTLLNGEAVAPYNRTAVNKWLLEGRPLETVVEEVPSGPDTSLLNRVIASRLDLADRLVHLHRGGPIRYRHLLIATGGRPRPLQVSLSSSAASAVTTLRDASDALRIQRLLEAVEARGGRPRVAVIGRGLLGAETAEVLAQRARAVHLVDIAARPLEPVLGSEIGGWVDASQRETYAGVHEAAVGSVEGRVGDLVVGLTDGSELHVDLAVVAIGVLPETEWLEDSGVDLTDGVPVDERLRVHGTADVYAAGDVARMTRGGRVEHWSHSRAQGVHAARVIAHRAGLADDPGPFRATPSYATRLHGRPVSVIGQVCAGQREVVLAAGEDPAMRATVRIDRAARIRAAVVLGAPKLARQLQPLVEATAPLSDADRVVAALSA